MKKRKLGPTVAINEYIVEGIGLRGAASAIAWANKKGYESGQEFTHKGRRVRVWLGGHYHEYYKEDK